MRAFERGATRAHTAPDGFNPEFCSVTFYREVSTFFCVKKTLFRGEKTLFRGEIVFFSPMSQKNTLFFVNFYLFIANFEVFPKKSVFWTHLFIGLSKSPSRAVGRSVGRSVGRPSVGWRTG